MRGEMRTKTIGSVVLGIIAVLFLLFLISPPLLFELIVGACSGDFHWFKGDLRQVERRDEKLPTVSIDGGIAYCRMYACDFRFPLPKASRVLKIEQTEGGFDTINGLIDVAATNGTSIDLDAYSAQIKAYHLEEGGWVDAEWTSTNNDVTQIRFSYFGDY
jgi:hypothetical protein